MSKKAYILIYSDAKIDRSDVKGWADNERKIVTWRYDLPNSFYLVSENSASELADSFEKAFGKVRFLITEISANRQGMLPKNTWYFLRNKKVKSEN